MAPRGTAVVAAALALAPAFASAGFPVAIYPFKVPGLTAVQRDEVHGLLEAALASAARRGVLSSRSPALLPKTCGDAPAPACLAQVAAGGLVLAGRGELRSGLVLVTAALWDSAGNPTREVRFAVDLVIQNLRPVGEAILELEVEIEPDGKVARGARAPRERDPHGPPAVRPPSLAAAPARAAPSPAAARALPAARAASPSAIEVSAPRAAPGRWRRTAGPWLAGVGAALVAGGAAAGWRNRDLSRELDAKYASGTLSPADRTSYDRVKTLNVVSTALFAAGGAATAAGAWLWISAPGARDEIALVGAGGRF
jgi:hypothetical protein